MNEPSEPCAAAQNGMAPCDADHHARGVACEVCAPPAEDLGDGARLLAGLLLLGVLGGGS